MRAQAVGHVLDRRHALRTAFGDDIGGAELQRQLLPWFVAAHRDDPFRAELSCGQHPEQPDRAVADDNDRLARPHLGRDRGEPAGTEHVGGGQEVRHQILGGNLGGRDQGPVGERHPHPLRLRGTGRAECLTVGAGGLVAGSADLTGVV